MTPSPASARPTRSIRRFVSPMLVAAAALAAWCAPAPAQDWPMWGRDPSRNMVAPDATGLPADFDPGKRKEGTDQIDPATMRNVRWVAKLGSQAHGNVAVAGGRVFIGTNNEAPRDPRFAGDRSVLMTFAERDGRLLWQLPVPKLGTGKVSDWEYTGLCSSPAIEGERLYVVTNRGEVACLDVHGQANGNDGPATDEGQYLAGPGKPPAQVQPTDPDLIWRFDMREECGVFPHNVSSNAVLVVGDRLYAATSNGQDWSHVNIPAPKAPALVCLDKKTGKLLGEEVSGISQRMFHCNWSSPAYGQVNGKGIIFFGGGDGFLYAFDPVPVPGKDGGVLRELWRVDCNPPEYRTGPDGKARRYATSKGPSEIIGTPVFHDGKVYVAIGQDPEHGDGVGALTCIDASVQANGGPDVTRAAIKWQCKTIARSISTPSVAGGLVYIADYSGVVHCLDAATGQVQWTHETGAHIWASTVVADGKVYVGNEDGDLFILAAGRQKKLINKVAFHGQITSTVVPASGALYVSTQSHLFAIGK